MNIFPEGYGLGPGPRHPFQTYTCNRCGSVVTSADLHDKWHFRIAPAEIDIETEALTSDSPETGPWERVADIPDDVDRISDFRGEQWRRRYSNWGQSFWEHYGYAYPKYVWTPATLPESNGPFRLSTRKDI